MSEPRYATTASLTEGRGWDFSGDLMGVVGAVVAATLLQRALRGSLAMKQSQSTRATFPVGEDVAMMVGIVLADAATVGVTTAAVAVNVAVGVEFMTRKNYTRFNCTPKPL